MTGMEGVWMGHREWIWASLNKSLLMYASLWGRNGITVLRRHLQKQQHENKGSIDQTDSTMLHTLHYLWMWWGSGKGQNVHKAITFKKEWEREWECSATFVLNEQWVVIPGHLDGVRSAGLPSLLTTDVLGGFNHILCCLIVPERPLVYWDLPVLQDTNLHIIVTNSKVKVDISFDLNIFPHPS